MTPAARLDTEPRGRSAAGAGADAVPGHDLRLVPAATVIWGGALAGLLCGWQVGVGVGACAVVGGLWIWRRARRRATPAVSVLSAMAGAALCVSGLLVLGPLSVRLHGAEHDPLRATADDGAAVTLRAEIRERPRAVRADTAGAPSVRVPVETMAARTGGESTSDGTSIPTGGRLLLIAPAESWERVLPGQQVTVSASLAPARSGDLTVAVGYVRGPPERVGDPAWWQRAADAVRGGLRDASGVLDADEAGLLPGLVVGDTSGQSQRVRDEFLDAGMSHLTAVSGTHVAIVCGAVLLVTRALRLGPRTSAGVAGSALVGFVVLVGYQPSVLRAGVMGGLTLAALALGRRRSAVPALAFAVGLLVVYDPDMATDLGFTLSVVATAGLVFLAPRWVATLARRRIPPGIAEALAVPVAAFVVTAPVLAGMVGDVSVVSAVANLLAAPVVAPVMVLGVLAAILAVPWPAVAEVLVHIAGPGVRWLVLVARESSNVPGAVVSWPPGWWGGLLAGGVVVLGVAALRYRTARTAAIVAVVAALVVVVPMRVLAPGWPPAGWSVVACDVGQGDGLVLSTGDPGRAVVVDAGPDPGPLDRCLNRLGVDRLPLVAVSHLHDDHFGGLAAAFEGRAVGAVGVGEGRAPAWAWREVSGQAREHGVPVVELTVGQRLRWNDLTLEVLGPHYTAQAARVDTDSAEHHGAGRRSDERGSGGDSGGSGGDSGEDGTAINNASLVLRASTPAGRVLFTGDAELAEQGDLLARNVDVRAEVLKVPHHGSRNTRPEFLRAVRPRVALVSVGADNRHGHPNGEIVRNLRAGGALVARTDEGGDIAVTPDEDGEPVVVRRGADRR